MSGHTPAPWRIEHGAGHAPNRIVGAQSIQTNGWREPRAGISNASYSDKVCENLGDLSLPGPAANAHLIAAAPLLFARVKKDVDECGHCGGSGRHAEIISGQFTGVTWPCEWCSYDRALLDLATKGPSA